MCRPRPPARSEPDRRLLASLPGETAPMPRLLNVRPRGGGRLLLGLIPILIVVLVYLAGSTARQAPTRANRILPTIGDMAQQVHVMAFQVDPQTGHVPLVVDTIASLKRLGAGIALAAGTTLILGLAIGLLPVVRGRL